jgi:CHASE1-domain containing sensor protein
MLRSNCLRKIFTGGSLLLFIPILEWVAVPHASRLTTDFNYTAELFSVDNLYDETEQRFSGNVLSVSKFNYSTDSITQNGILLIKNDFEVKKPSGEPIFAVERFYGIHPKTQAHVQGVGDRDRTGYLFAPPNVKDKTSFEYWHINYNTPVTMHFTAEEHIAGLKVYRYSGNLIADQTENLGFLPGVPEQRGVELDVFLEIWIDPESRHLIKFEDYATGWFYNIKTHERLNPWNKFHNEFKQSSILEHVQKAKSIQYNIKLLKYYIPILILVFCIFLYISCRIKKNELEIHLPKLIGFTVFGLIMGLNIFYFYFEKSNQNQLTLEETEDNAGKTLSYIKNELDNCKLILNLLRFEYEKKSDITEHQFHSTASFLLKRSSAIKALAYIPVVNEHERSLFEKSLIARGANTLGFTEFDFTKKLKGASQRTVYAPVFFIEPLEGNTSVLGFDLLSDSSRIATLEAAKKTRDLTVTAPIKLVQETDSNRFGIIIFNPVFKNGKLKGYFSGVFDIQSLMNTALNSHEIEDEVSFIVYDVLPNQTKIFYQTPGYRSSKEQPMAVTKQIPYLNRVFRFNFYLDEPKDLTMGYILLSIGTLLSIISGLLSFRILNDKTTQLTEHSQHLHRATQVLQHKNMQLMDFCNIVSHNLRAPLANISMLIDYA